MDGITAILIVVKRTILIDEEVTLDYNWSYIDFNNITECLCKEVGCRKIIEKLPRSATVDAIFSSLEKPKMAGIYNYNVKPGSICFFISVVQFLFRGVSFDVVKKICLENIETNNKTQADVGKKVVNISKQILSGNFVPYSKKLHELALMTNDDKYAQTHNNVSDASRANQSLLDCSNNILKLVDLFFQRCIGFILNLPLQEALEEKIIKKKQKKKIVEEKVLVPGCNILKYDLQETFRQQLTRKDDCFVWHDIENRLGSYFIINAHRHQTQVHKKSLTNTLCFVVESSEASISGYALLRAYIVCFEMHYSTYVLNR